MLAHRMIQGSAANTPTLSLSFINSATFATTTITIPSGFQAGDLCLIFNRAAVNSTTTPTTVVPSGFTSIQNLTYSDAGNSSAFRAIVSGKILNGSETTVTGMDSTVEGGIALVIRPSLSISGWTLNSSNVGSTTTGNPTAQTITSSGATSNLPIFVYCEWISYDGSGSTITSTPSLDVLSTNSTAHNIGYKIFNPGSTPVDYSVDMGDEGEGQGMNSGYLTFTLA